MKEDKELEQNETFLAITFKVTQTERLVGAAFINLHERLLMITEFADNEHFSGLESLVIQQNNSAADSKFKVLINLPNDMNRDKVQDTMQMCEVDFVFAENKKDFSCANIQLAMNTLLKGSFSYMIEESELELALGALNAGIAHMNLLQKCDSAQKQFTLKRYTLGQFLRLDVAALKALNVFPSQQS